MVTCDKRIQMFKGLDNEEEHFWKIINVRLNKPLFYTITRSKKLLVKCKDPDISNTTSLNNNSWYKANQNTQGSRFTS